MSRFRIGIDQDGTLVSTNTKLLHLYNRDYDDNMKEEDITKWELSELVKPECGKKVLDYYRTAGFFRNLKPLPRAQEGIRYLHSLGHELFLVTDGSCSSDSFKDKWESCEEHFPQIYPKKRMFVGDKSAFLGDILIDDGVHNLKVFKGWGILFDAPHNRDCNEYYRVKNWDEIIELARMNFSPMIMFYENKERVR